MTIMDTSKSLMNDIETITQTELKLMRQGQIRDLAPMAIQKKAKLDQLEKLLKELPQDQVAREFMTRLVLMKSQAEQAASLYKGLLTGVKSAQMRLDRISGRKSRIGTYAPGGKEMILTDASHDAEKRV